MFNIFTCGMHQGVCSCGNKYVGETMTNATTWIDKHEQEIGKSERFKHMEKIILIEYKYGCKALWRAHSHRLKRKTLEAYQVVKFIL